MFSTHKTKEDLKLLFTLVTIYHPQKTEGKTTNLIISGKDKTGNNISFKYYCWHFFTLLTNVP